MNFYPAFNDSDFLDFNIIEYYNDLISEIAADVLFAYNNENYIKTLELIDKYLTNNPNDSNLITVKAVVLFKLSYIDDALFYCDVALNINDSNDFTWLAKSILLKNNNCDKEALICYKLYVFLKYHKNLSISQAEINKKPIDLKIKADYDFTEDYANNFINFDELFTQDNLNILKSNLLTISQYKDILNKIRVKSQDILKKTVSDNFINIDSLDLLDKSILYTKIFADVKYKADGSELGSYYFNEIFLDDRLYISNQVTTLIHELAHHLLREIFEQALMCILNTSKSYIIEFFASYIFIDNDNYLLDEYCANKVQSRFTPHGYQEFDSAEDILQSCSDLNLSNNDIAIAISLGNTFSKDILWIIEDLFDYEIREEIKNQFQEDLKQDPDYAKMGLEDSKVVNDNIKIKKVNLLLINTFEEIMDNPNEFKLQFGGNL